MFTGTLILLIRFSTNIYYIIRCIRYIFDIITECPEGLTNSIMNTPNKEFL